MQRFIRLFIIQVFIVLLSSTSSQAVQLRYNLTVGQSYAYDCTIAEEGITGLNIGGQTRNMTTKTDGKIGMVMMVKELTPRDTFLVETLFDAFSLKISALGQSTYLPPSAGLKGKKMVVEIDRRGKLIKLETPAFQVPDIFMSADNLLENVLPSLPAADIQPGQKWETIRRVPLPQGGSINVAITYTFKGQLNVDDAEYYRIESVIDIPLDIASSSGITSTKAGAKEKYVVNTSTLYETATMMPVRIDSSTKVVTKIGDPQSGGATNTDMDIKTTMLRRK
ncbi:MAG: hypothetical protein PHD91_05125 [bacterium]|jgi:hypothetical protein|nr:hypothetical protein [bacterium]MDD3805244.1 hypothetical protein [bacterium]MDD4153078.1 hypothetical protein [bacterium]MDD4558378.1 hypothetical protein [bacterium]